MKTILVLSLHPGFAEANGASLNAEQYRVVHRLSVDDAEPLLVNGLAAACIVDLDLLGVEGVWGHRAPPPTRHQVARHRLHTADNQSEWEEEIFLRGVTHVLTKPVRGRLLNSLLERLEAAPRPGRRPRRRKTHSPGRRNFPQPRAVIAAPTARRAAGFLVPSSPIR